MTELCTILYLTPIHKQTMFEWSCTGVTRRLADWSVEVEGARVFVKKFVERTTSSAYGMADWNCALFTSSEHVRDLISGPFGSQSIQLPSLSFEDICVVTVFSYRL